MLKALREGAIPIPLWQDCGEDHPYNGLRMRWYLWLWEYDQHVKSLERSWVWFLMACAVDDHQLRKAVYKNLQPVLQNIHSASVGDYGWLLGSKSHSDGSSSITGEQYEQCKVAWEEAFGRLDDPKTQEKIRQLSESLRNARLGRQTKRHAPSSARQAKPGSTTEVP